MTKKAHFGVPSESHGSKGVDQRVPRSEVLAPSKPTLGSKSEYFAGTSPFL